VKLLLDQYKQQIAISSDKQLNSEIRLIFINKHNKNRKKYKRGELQVAQIKTILSNLQITFNKC
jgi:hypothetical protein